jgi:hypothetical protein
VLLAICVVGLLALALTQPKMRWIATSMLFAAIATHFAKEAGALSKVRPDAVRSLLLFIATALPMLSYGVGHRHSYDIMSGNAFTYATNVAPALGLSAHNDPLKSPRYVGYAGGFVFFLDPSNQSTLIAKVNDSAHFALKPYRAKLKENAAPSAAASVAPANAAAHVPAGASPR